MWKIGESLDSPITEVFSLFITFVFTFVLKDIRGLCTRFNPGRPEMVSALTAEDNILYLWDSAPHFNGIQRWLWTAVIHPRWTNQSGRQVAILHSIYYTVTPLPLWVLRKQVKRPETTGIIPVLIMKNHCKW